MKLILILLTKLDKAFGKSLKERGLASFLTQEALAMKFNLFRAYVSKLEIGKKDPSLFTVFKLARALEIKSSFFIDEIERIL